MVRKAFVHKTRILLTYACFYLTDRSLTGLNTLMNLTERISIPLNSLTSP
jgi:hypothetical protein